MLPRHYVIQFIFYMPEMGHYDTSGHFTHL